MSSSIPDGLGTAVLLPGYPEARPFPQVSRRVLAFLHTFGCGLSQVVHSLGAPLRWDRRRAVEYADSVILVFRRETGRPPKQRDLKSMDNWLRKHGTSLSKRCAVLGLPTRQVTKHTQISVDQALLSFWSSTGALPRRRQLRAEDDWLRYRGSSILKRCRELGLPVSPRSARAA